MVGSNKILTVSYGTFSCTLEGFDDPFSAMKSIAEYFRDLAAEDRYFGAEPPTPDPETLHRIAEREVRRRVEARTSSDGIVLRQLDAGDTPGPAMPMRPAMTAAMTAPVAAPDSVVSKLSRIRAVVDRARVASVEARPVPPPAAVAAASLGLGDDAFLDIPATPRAAAAAPTHAVSPEPAPQAPETAPETETALADEAPVPQDASQPAERAEDLPGAPEDLPAEAAPDEDAGRVIRLDQVERAPDDEADETYDEDEATSETDDITLEGIRMALSAEQDALAQERKEARMERRHVLIGGDPDREPAFDRILEETNSKMQDREGTRRRSAIAHLKAAVAATKADRLLKRERSREIDEEEQRDYREDLAKVVRPHTSEPRESAAEKARAAAAKAGPAPLVLGSSHRIDPVADATEARPRRVSAMIAMDDEPELDTITPGRDESAFIAFAQATGARDLPDVLEAAAAYTAFVEGNSSFSRPQIMRRAAAVETDEEFTREAGLRSFGQLLRQGKIRKLQRGQFTIAENTRFRPKARIAGE